MNKKERELQDRREYNTPNPKVPKFEVCDTSELSEVLRLTALLGEERAISDALALRVDELKAELASSRVGFAKVSPYEPGSRGRFSDVKFRISWEPRWPCAAIGFYRGKRTDKYSKFSVILWALVFEIGVKE